jgi:acyl-coenzyme A synthetase/AMP-(fatty) acid ligase
VAPRALIEWINARVGAKFQRVSDVLLVDDLPRNVAGKTLKRVLAARYAENREAVARTDSAAAREPGE